MNININNLTQVFCFAVLLCFSTNLGAVGSTLNSQKVVASVFDLPVEDILQKDTKALEIQAGRKLSIKEKTALFFTKRKMKKAANTNEKVEFEEEKTHGLAIASLVCGIVGFVLMGFVVLGVLAIIFGAISLKKIRRSGGFLTGRGMAIAGLVLGIVALAFIFSLLTLAIVLV